MLLSTVHPVLALAPSIPASRYAGRATASESMTVKSFSSTRPARLMASRLRTWVTRCTSWIAARARACDQPTRGTLTHSGLQASAINKTRTGDTCFLNRGPQHHEPRDYRELRTQVHSLYRPN